MSDCEVLLVGGEKEVFSDVSAELKEGALIVSRTVVEHGDVTGLSDRSDVVAIYSLLNIVGLKMSKSIEELELEQADYMDRMFGSDKT